MIFDILNTEAVCNQHVTVVVAAGGGVSLNYFIYILLQGHQINMRARQMIGR